MFHRNAPVVGALIALLAMVTNASAASTLLLDFESFSHGQIIDDDMPGVTVSVDNFRSGGPDLGVIFDTRLRNTPDDDLEGPNGANGSWAGGGNIPSDEILGNALIIPTRGGDDGNGFLDEAPNDEGRRPAGVITMLFDSNIRTFGFDLIDVEGPVEYGNGGGFVASFFSNGSLVTTIDFADFVTPGSLVYDAGITFGNNSANRIVPIDLQQFGPGMINKVQIAMGGSGAVDNILVTMVPTPSAVAVGIMMLGGLTIIERRKRRKMAIA
jgi:hypothetical protein